MSGPIEKPTRFVIETGWIVDARGKKIAKLSSLFQTVDDPFASAVGNYLADAINRAPAP